MSKSKFKPVKYTDPRTKKVRIISGEEQEQMLEKGILLDIPLEPDDSDSTMK